MSDGFVSIAHTAGVHVVVTSPRPIGVDAEADAPAEGIEAVALHRAERAVVSRWREADRNHGVLEIWVAKEAALKLVGTGVRTAPESFVVRHADGWGVEPGVLSASPILITPVEVPGYVVMLASHEPVRLAAEPRLCR